LRTFTRDQIKTSSVKRLHPRPVPSVQSSRPALSSPSVPRRQCRAPPSMPVIHVSMPTKKPP
jgi:hypothetical protein